MDNALGLPTMDVFGPVPLRGNEMSLFPDSRINERMESLGGWCIFGDSVSRTYRIIPELIHMELMHISMGR